MIIACPFRQQIRNRRDNRRIVRPDVDHRVPTTVVREAGKISPFPVAVNFFHAGEKIGAGFAAIEQGHSVAAINSTFDKGRAEETSAAENENLLR
jgi:hypothetical protein